ncbi:3-ketoacyl CoA thiolase 1, peroxisomal-like isoform X1 [Capsicum annuum]|uniref:3-ketoacyl CoA thiolase 1, peroxisomal-like isoform X1 n=1 Tax=Capsicum annuum TaxID=4072 RepID=UPI001FB14475|nr:3-ketoacyl CoA thiolase 1, peroxisomal-like isoform X1 [Capsicum annuum]
MEREIERQRVLLDHLHPIRSFSNHESSSFTLVTLLHTLGKLLLGMIAYRTAICKFKRGGFKDILSEYDLLAPVLKAVIEKINLNPDEAGDIVVGTVLTPGSIRAMECRIAAFYASFPGHVLLMRSMT